MIFSLSPAPIRYREETIEAKYSEAGCCKFALPKWGAAWEGSDDQPSLSMVEKRNLLHHFDQHGSKFHWGSLQSNVMLDVLLWTLMLVHILWALCFHSLILLIIIYNNNRDVVAQWLRH